MPSRRLLIAGGVLLAAIFVAQTAVLLRARPEADPAETAEIASLRADVRALTQAHAQAQARLERIEEATARSASLLAEVRAWTEAQESYLRSAAIAASSTPTPVGSTGSDRSTDEAGDPSDRGTGKAGISEVLDRLARMEKKLGRRKGGEEWKPTVAELDEALDLEPHQESGLVQTANRAKDELMALARVPRADGGTFLDDFADAINESKSNPAAAQAAYGALIARLMVEKVPGRNGTYFAEIVALSAQAHREFQSTLTPEQYQELQERDVDVFGIKTGYDPIGDYAAARVPRRK